MIRFIDLSETYWTDPEEHGGPVCAFLETRTDRFMVANVSNVFNCAESIDDIEDASLRERCREHVPHGFWERKQDSRPIGEMYVSDGEEAE